MCSIRKADAEQDRSRSLSVRYRSTDWSASPRIGDILLAFDYLCNSLAFRASPSVDTFIRIHPLLVCRQSLQRVPEGTAEFIFEVITVSFLPCDCEWGQIHWCSPSSEQSGSRLLADNGLIIIFLLVSVCSVTNTVLYPGYVD